jgi:carbamoyltransferase
MKDLINHEIKGRESFRPLAPMVLAEDADAFFEMAEESPHMLFAAATRLEERGTIPAVVHVDGSARVQTVSDKDDKFLRALLQTFKKMTGIGVLLNTSFNGPGDPIVETIEQALACMAETRIDALIAPPFVVEKTGLAE